MTTIAAQPRRSHNLAQSWLRTGGDHPRADAPSHHRSNPATAAFNDRPNHQAELLPPAGRVIKRLQGLCAPALTPSASAKHPL